MIFFLPLARHRVIVAAKANVESVSAARCSKTHLLNVLTVIAERWSALIMRGNFNLLFPRTDK